MPLIAFFVSALSLFAFARATGKHQEILSVSIAYQTASAVGIGIAYSSASPNLSILTRGWSLQLNLPTEMDMTSRSHYLSVRGSGARVKSFVNDKIEIESVREHVVGFGVLYTLDGFEMTLDAFPKDQSKVGPRFDANGKRSKKVSDVEWNLSAQVEGGAASWIFPDVFVNYTLAKTDADRVSGRMTICMEDEYEFAYLSFRTIGFEMDDLKKMPMTVDLKQRDGNASWKCGLVSLNGKRNDNAIPPSVMSVEYGLDSDNLVSVPSQNINFQLSFTY